MGSIGGFNKGIAQFIYRSAREEVNRLVESGHISHIHIDKEWAKLVAERLRDAGFSIPKKIARML